MLCEFDSLQGIFEYLHAVRNGRLNIVAIGATGGGKSSTLNSFLKHASGRKRAKFHAEEAPTSVTKKFQECRVDLFGLDCRLIDTVGLFDTNMTRVNKGAQLMSNMEKHNNVLANLAEVISLCTDGIDAFLFVIDATQRAVELPETIEVIQKFFENDVAKAGTMNKWKEEIKKQLVLNNYDDIGDRFIPFDNEKQHECQVIQLLKMIEENINAHDGCPYTNVVFKRAQEIMEAEKLQLQMELEAEYQRQIAERIIEITDANEEEMKKVKESLEKEYTLLAEANKEELKRSERVIQELLDQENRLEKDSENAINGAQINERFRVQEDMISKQNNTIQQLVNELKSNQLNPGNIPREPAVEKKSQETQAQGISMADVLHIAPAVLDAAKTLWSMLPQSSSNVQSTYTPYGGSPAADSTREYGSGNPPGNNVAPYPPYPSSSGRPPAPMPKYPSGNDRYPPGPPRRY